MTFIKKTQMDKENNVIKKTEKIVSACVLLSSFIKEDHALREEIEVNAISLLLDISRIILLPYYERERDVKTCIRKIDHIVSCVNVGNLSGLISTPDKKLITEELFRYAQELSTVYNDFSVAENRAILHPSFFSDETPNDSRPIVLVQNKTDGDGTKNTPISAQNDFNKTVPEKDTKGQNREKDTNKNSKKSDSKGHRREIIIGLFKKRKGEKLTIKDIALEITDCSEKTIQRELLTLVAENVLKKEGERRWSTYELRS